MRTTARCSQGIHSLEHSWRRACAHMLSWQILAANGHKAERQCSVDTSVIKYDSPMHSNSSNVALMPASHPSKISTDAAASR